MLKESTVKRFCNDYSLPIQIYNPDFIEYYIDLYDKVYDTKAKYELFKTAVNEFKTEDEFLAYGNELQETVLNYIKNVAEYTDLCNCNINELYPLQNNLEGVRYTKTVNLYRQDNSGKDFISFDMRRANYQALKFYNSKIVNNTNTYEEFISKFTDKEYFKQSKHIRQYIFGKLNHDRIVHLERYLMQKVLFFLFDCEYEPEDIVTYTTDEVIVHNTDDNRKGKSFCNSASHSIKNYTDGLDIRVESFRLNYIGHNTYVKEFKYQNPVFKGGSSVYMPQIYKHYFNMPIKDIDLCFLYEKQPSKFLNPLEWN